MEDSAVKSVSLIFFILITAPNLVSMLASIVGAIYFISMLKLNVVDVRYGGSWKAYFKSIFRWKNPK